MEQKQRLINLLFCGLQNFDLAREVDKVLEFVSPNKTKWKVLTDQQGDLHRTYQRTIKLYDHPTDKGRKADQSKKHAQEKPKMLKMHRLLLNCDNHAQKGKMQQSHEHRWGIR